MKSPRFSKDQALPSDPFSLFDAFLTDLIIDRAPVDARTGLSHWFENADKQEAAKPKIQTRSRRKAKTVLAAA